MIVIHHNFDETKFKWLWAKYVKAGNIEKHCTACLIGPYSKKFSGTSNHDLLEQPSLVMDEFPEGDYEAIYFCGVIKKGYLNKNPLKNNYPHNVHFAVKPVEGAHDVWDFEKWHVEIENGKLERIPETYELSERFFQLPYNSHYYTCRIFRWMVGHFYPKKLNNKTFNYPEFLYSDRGYQISSYELISDLIRWGKSYADDFLNDETCLGFFDDKRTKDVKFRSGLVNRKDLATYIAENMGGGCGPMPLEVYSDIEMSEDEMIKFLEIGIDEYLDLYFPYQERLMITES